MTALGYSSVFQKDKVKSSKGYLNFTNGCLTKRESDILKHIILGYSAKEIAKILNISFRTVESYMNSLKLKLHCNSKGEVILMAIKSGLIHQLDIL